MTGFCTVYVAEENSCADAVSGARDMRNKATIRLSILGIVARDPTLRIQFAVTADVDKLNLSIACFFKDRANVACYIDTPAPLPLARQCMIAEKWMVCIFYKQSESIVKFFLYRHWLFPEHLFEYTTVGDKHKVVYLRAKCFYHAFSIVKWTD